MTVVIADTSPLNYLILIEAIDLLPEWIGSYSTLGVFYFQTGQIEKAREVLNRFKGSTAGGSLDVNRIEAALSKGPPTASSARKPGMSACEE